MKAAVLVFPGSNCDRDLAVGFRHAGFDVEMVWHKGTALPDGTDIVGIPGGFSYGDYLRCGAIAAHAPIMKAVSTFAQGGGPVIGICNGFQVLIEAGLLPGVLMRNAGLNFLCKDVDLVTETEDSVFTRALGQGGRVRFPIAHHDGNYFADDITLERLKKDDRVAFRYAANPNGSRDDIAGILSENRRVLGMMPHPERANDAWLGGTDGARFFAGLADALIPA